MTLIVGIKTYWNSLTPNVRGAIVGATLTALLAVVGTVVMKYYLDRRPNLEIINVITSTFAEAPAIEITLRNNADIPELTTSLILFLSNLQQLAPFTPSSGHVPIYEAEPVLKSTGDISGCVRDADKTSINRFLCRPLKGALSLLSYGDWRLQFVLPIQEEIPPHSHLSIAIVFQKTMNIPMEKLPEGIFNHLLVKRYLSGGHKKSFFSIKVRE